MNELFELLNNQQKAEVRKKCFDKICQAIDKIEVKSITIDLSEDIVAALRSVLENEGTEIISDYVDLTEPLSNIFELILKRAEEVIRTQLGF